MGTHGAIIPLRGGTDMPKSNTEAVRDYHDKLVEIKVRFPSAEQCGYDFPALIRERAEELGILNARGRDKGRGSANGYILHLIEKDLGIEVKGISQIEK